MPIASGVLWILHWCTVSALVSPGDAMLMCHTGALKCVTPTQDKFTPEKKSSVHKITNVDEGIPRLERLVGLSSKKHQSRNFVFSLEEDVILGFFFCMMNVKQTPSLKAL